MHDVEFGASGGRKFVALWSFFPPALSEPNGLAA